MPRHEYEFKKRLVDNEIKYINAKLMGEETETISEFPSTHEAKEALPALKALYPDHIVFISDVCVVSWRELDRDMKVAVMDILDDMVA